MIRVLHVLGGLGSGGAEALIMNWYRDIDRTKVQFDFLVRSDDSNYVDEIELLGGRVFRTSSFPKHLIRNYVETNKILKKQEWDVIHVHANAAIYILPLLLASRYDYKKVIMHSHSVASQRSGYRYIHLINRRIVNRIAGVKLACSNSAGLWMFGENANFCVIHNAINIDRFKFCSEKRAELRKYYNIQNKFVIGNVGRLTKEKNHEKLLEIFKEIRKKSTNAYLLLVGDGKLEAQIRMQADNLEIKKYIVFAGRQKDVGAYLSAMDAFVFPSLWEGLGIVLVEALANGLPCLSSVEATVGELRVFSGLQTLALTESNETWANTVLNLKNRERDSAYIEAVTAGYCSTDVAKQLEKIYCG